MQLLTSHLHLDGSMMPQMDSCFSPVYQLHSLLLTLPLSQGLGIWQLHFPASLTVVSIQIPPRNICMRFGEKKRSRNQIMAPPRLQQMEDFAVASSIFPWIIYLWSWIYYKKFPELLQLLCSLWAGDKPCWQWYPSLTCVPSPFQGFCKFYHLKPFPA